MNRLESDQLSQDSAQPRRDDARAAALLAAGGTVTIEVRLPTLLRAAADGKASVAVDGATVGEVLRSLEREHPALSGQVLTDDGTLHKFVNVYLNDDDVRYLDRLDTSVEAEDVVSILPAVAGG